MADISLAEAKARLSKLIARVAAGDRVRITRRGRPVAELTPVSAERKPVDVAALRAVTDAAPRQGQPAGELVRRMRDEDRY